MLSTLLKSSEGQVANPVLNRRRRDRRDDWRNSLAIERYFRPGGGLLTIGRSYSLVVPTG
jgi:hypothetical protein